MTVVIVKFAATPLVPLKLKVPVALVEVSCTWTVTCSGVLVMVQVMASPAAGVILKLVPFPEGRTVVELLVALVQLIAEAYWFKRVAPEAASDRVRAVPVALFVAVAAWSPVELPVVVAVIGVVPSVTVKANWSPLFTLAATFFCKVTVDPTTSAALALETSRFPVTPVKFVAALVNVVIAEALPRTVAVTVQLAVEALMLPPDRVTELAV